MWDFEIGRTLGIVIRTWPFVVLRIIVFFGITVAYIASWCASASPRPTCCSCSTS